MLRQSPDPYAILGVPHNASQLDIVNAYRKRVRVLHPDRFDQNMQPQEWRIANEMMAQLNAAYHLLRHPELRAAYDRRNASLREASRNSAATTADSKAHEGEENKDDFTAWIALMAAILIGSIVIPCVTLALFPKRDRGTLHEHNYPATLETGPRLVNKLPNIEPPEHRPDAPWTRDPIVRAPPDLSAKENDLPPAQPLPQSGEITRFVSTPPVAPLEIVTRSPGVNYFVKVCDWYSDEAVAEIFIRGGESCDVTLPIGTYRIKYATGTTWYGPQYLFGINTSYNKADATFYFKREADGFSGYTVELFSQVNGNLTTTSIHPTDW